MKLGYYPGCTLKNAARNFEASALASLRALGIEAEELPRWNCCGTVFSLATDDLIHHVATARNLLRAQEAGSDAVLTLCAMCYNTLKRSNERLRRFPGELQTINDFMSDETAKYRGRMRVLHLLELLRDETTFAGLAKKVVRPLAGLRVASYYGCYLTRPAGIGCDDLENPVLLDEIMTALGATAMPFPHQSECCGSYQTVNEPDLVAERAFQILTSARRHGADCVAVSCPLCAFNLDHRQRRTREIYPDFVPLPVFYFTQLTALALGCDETSLLLDLHAVDPRPVLRKRGLLSPAPHPALSPQMAGRGINIVTSSPPSRGRGKR